MNHKRIFAAKVVCVCFVMVRLISMVAFLITINQESFGMTGRLNFLILRCAMFLNFLILRCAMFLTQ